jgi:hypothetical protein
MVMSEAVTTEDGNVEEEPSIQLSFSRNHNCSGTIVTTTDATLPDISELDIMQSAKGSAHSDLAKAIDNHTVLAGVLKQPTDESQQNSTAQLRDYAVPSFLSLWPGFTLPKLLVRDLAAARA